MEKIHNDEIPSAEEQAGYNVQIIKSYMKILIDKLCIYKGKTDNINEMKNLTWDIYDMLCRDNVNIYAICELYKQLVSLSNKFNILLDDISINYTKILEFALFNTNKNG